MNKILLGIALAVLLVFAAVVVLKRDDTFGSGRYTSNHGIIFQEDFEHANFAYGPYNKPWQTETARPDSFMFVSDIVREGKTALKINIAPRDTVGTGNRAELFLPNYYPAIGDDLIFSWSLYIPDNYIDPKDSLEWIIFGQLHTTRVKGSPIIALEYVIVDGKPSLVVFRHQLSDNEKKPLLFTNIKKGEWNDIELRIKMSPTADGFVEAKLNGISFNDLQGNEHIITPTMHDSLPHFWKIGIYRDANIAATNTIYIDNFTVMKI